MTLVEQVWQKVDEDMLALMQPEPNTDFVSLKARLRAFAEVLAIFMKPHFTTADEIAREARRRYDSRMDESYCTPGLNQRRYEPPPGTPSLQEAYVPLRSSRTPRTVADPHAAAISKLTDQQIETIKTFAAQGFPHDALAKAQGISIAVIKAVIGG